MSTYSADDYKNELDRVKQNSLFHRMVRSTVYTLVTVAAVAVLVAVLLLPVLRIYGTSITPTLEEGEYVLSIKGERFATGDVIAFYYNNKVLVKRVIADSRKRHWKIFSSFPLPFHRYDHNSPWICFSIRRVSSDCGTQKLSSPDGCSSSVPSSGYI